MKNQIYLFTFVEDACRSPSGVFSVNSLLWYWLKISVTYVYADWRSLIRIVQIPEGNKIPVVRRLSMRMIFIFHVRHVWPFWGVGYFSFQLTTNLDGRLFACFVELVSGFAFIIGVSLGCAIFIWSNFELLFSCANRNQVFIFVMNQM